VTDTRRAVTAATALASDKIGPGDPRYAALVQRGFYKRAAGKPDYIRVVDSTEQVIEAVEDAVRNQLRLAVRSGGHCLEGFVSDPAVRVIIDMSLMTDVAYDPEMNAFMVEAGAKLGEVYRKLFLGWGVMLPAGESPEIGAGGHICGGAFGFFCREHGLAADHLYGVEVVVVDENGGARSVVATRDPSDPNRELWWAHTGGGGGNFGVVTRYWLRSPGADGTEPASLLPEAPDSVLVFRAGWRWEDLDPKAFARLLHNYGEWCEHNAGADSPCTRLFSTFFLHRHELGKVVLRGLSTAGSEAEQLAREHLAAINRGVRIASTFEVERLSWLGFVLDPFPEIFRPVVNGALVKGKDAFLRRRFTDRQIEVIYHYLTRTDHEVPGGMLGLLTYGGKVNSLPADETASPQRDSVMSSACVAGWADPGEEARHLAWVRGFYRELFADTGGVPAPGERCDGAMINHPDADLADPAWNTSGTPWHTLYYKDNYPRLQLVKTRWDPRNLFHHKLSVQPS
jgi:FAD binding domain/Berberine and berberine like